MSERYASPHPRHCGQYRSDRRQYALIYEFLIDYHIAGDTDKMTAQELRDFVEAMLVRIDEYFFHGGLTQGPKRLVSLSVLEHSRHDVAGFFYFSRRYDTGRVVVYLRGSFTGGRWSKNMILQTLVHELAHAYCGLFFNYYYPVVYLSIVSQLMSVSPICWNVRASHSFRVN
ncbi:hypothetical protein F5B18DRAFT_415857 [Nemania serpens]|nr:hypothetical protein F5B18DRAFT_415857 [Nemania serpens]